MHNSPAHGGSSSEALDAYHEGGPMKILVDDPVVCALITQLPQAASMRHSGRAFIEHLAVTWRILSDWKMPVAVCRAGFLHSAYATSYYPYALFEFSDRELLRRCIGREAEGLVFRFCRIDRRGYWEHLLTQRSSRVFSYPDRLRGGAPVRIARKTLERLLIIDSANIAEQSKAPNGSPAPWMSRILGWWEFLDDRTLPVYPGARARLGALADREAIAAYSHALQLPSPKALPVLNQAIGFNPWAGELRILRALCARESGISTHPDDASVGAELLQRWAVAWDKRLSAAAWRALASRLARQERSGKHSHPDFATLVSMLARIKPIPRWLDV